MTKTARDLRSAAHALRTAANALEETVTALRALSDDLNEPDPEPEPAAPAWPTAPFVWHAGEVWQRQEDGRYESAHHFWTVESMTHNPNSTVCDNARRFAREAVPVTLVPTEAWEAWKSATRDLDYTPDCDLIDAVDSLSQEVAR